MDDVAVGDEVVAALGAKQAALAGPDVAARRDQVFPRDDLGADEALLDLGVDLARRLPGGRPRPHAARHRFLAGVRSEEDDQVEQVEGAVDDALQPGLGDPELGPHLRGLGVLELAELRLDPRGDRDRDRVGGPRVLGDRGRDLVLSLVHVSDVEDRLRRQRRELARGVRRRLRHGHVAHRPARRKRLDHALEPLALGDRLLVLRARLPRHSLQAPLGLLEICRDQLGLDQLDVVARVHPSLGVRNAAARVTADDVADRVGLADRGEEPVAEPLALRGPAHEARDVVELDRLGHRLARADGRSDALEPRIGDRHDRDVGVDGGERVVAGLGAGPRQRVEQGRLAGVRQTDYADLHAVSEAASAGAAAPPFPPACRVACARSFASTASSNSRSSAGSAPSPGTSLPMQEPSATPPSTSDG